MTEQNLSEQPSSNLDMQALLTSGGERLTNELNRIVGTEIETDRLIAVSLVQERLEGGKGSGLWVVFLKEKSYGIVGFVLIDIDLYDEKITHMSIFIKEKYRLRGYAKEIGRALLDLARKHQIRYVETAIVADEECLAAARAVARDLGFRDKGDGLICTYLT